MKTLSHNIFTVELPRLESAVKRNEEIFADCIALGQDAIRERDLRSIIVGTLAGFVERRYSEANIEDFADQIGVGVKSVYQYQSVVEFYGMSTCVEILEELALSYSHLRAAMRLGNREMALKLLELAAQEGWKVSRTEAEVNTKKAAWVALVDLERAELRQVDYRTGTVTFFVGDATRPLQERVGEKLKLQVKAKAVVEEVQREPATAG